MPRTGWPGMNADEEMVRTRAMAAILSLTLKPGWLGGVEIRSAGNPRDARSGCRSARSECILCLLWIAIRVVSLGRWGSGESLDQTIGGLGLETSGMYMDVRYHGGSATTLDQTEHSQAQKHHAAEAELWFSKTTCLGER